MKTSIDLSPTASRMSAVRRRTRTRTWPGYVGMRLRMVDRPERSDEHSSVWREFAGYSRGVGVRCHAPGIGLRRHRARLESPDLSRAPHPPVIHIRHLPHVHIPPALRVREPKHVDLNVRGYPLRKLELHPQPPRGEQQSRRIQARLQDFEHRVHAITSAHLRGGGQPDHQRQTAQPPRTPECGNLPPHTPKLSNLPSARSTNETQRRSGCEPRLFRGVRAHSRMLQKWGLGRAAAVSSALRTLARSAPHARGISKAVGDQAREQVAVRYPTAVEHLNTEVLSGRKKVGREQEMPG